MEDRQNDAGNGKIKYSVKGYLCATLSTWSMEFLYITLKQLFPTSKKHSAMLLQEAIG